MSNRTKLYLNGTHVTDPYFYAPTGSGTDGQHLRSNGEYKDPTWEYPIVTQLNGDNTSHNREIYAPSAVGDKYQVLESTGEGEPEWKDPMVTKINGYGPDYGRDNDIYVFLSKGNDGQIAYGGGSRPTWGDPIIATVNGGSGHLSKQIWAPESAGDLGQILQSNGSGDPRWIDSNHLYSHLVRFVGSSSSFDGEGVVQFYTNNNDEIYTASSLISVLGDFSYTSSISYLSATGAFALFGDTSKDYIIIGVYRFNTNALGILTFSMVSSTRVLMDTSLSASLIDVSDIVNKIF